MSAPLCGDCGAPAMDGKVCTGRQPHTCELCGVHISAGVELLDGRCVDAEACYERCLLKRAARSPKQARYNKLLERIEHLCRVVEELKQGQETLERTIDDLRDEVRGNDNDPW